MTSQVPSSAKYKHTLGEVSRFAARNLGLKEPQKLQFALFHVLPDKRKERVYVSEWTSIRTFNPTWGVLPRSVLEKFGFLTNVELELWARQDAVSESVLWGTFEVDFSKLERFCLRSVLSESVLPPVEGNSLIVHCVDQLYKYPLRILQQQTVATHGGALGKSDIHISPSFSHISDDKPHHPQTSPDIRSRRREALFSSPQKYPFRRTSSSSQGIISTHDLSVPSSPSRRKLRFDAINGSGGSKGPVQLLHHARHSSIAFERQLPRQETGSERRIVQSKSSSALDSDKSGSEIGDGDGDDDGDGDGDDLGKEKEYGSRILIPKAESFDAQSVGGGKKAEIDKASLDDADSRTSDGGISGSIISMQTDDGDDLSRMDGDGWRGCMISSTDLRIVYNDEMTFCEEKRHLLKEIKKRQAFFHNLLMERSAMTYKREDQPVRDISQVRERVEALRENVYKARMSVSATKKSVLALRHMVDEEVEELNRKANMLLDASQRYERVLVRRKYHLSTERNTLVRCLEVRRGKMLQMVTKIFHPLSSDHICGMHFDGCAWLFPTVQKHSPSGKGQKAVARAKAKMKVRDPGQIETIMGHISHLLKVLSGIYGHNVGFRDKELVLMGSKSFFRGPYTEKSFREDRVMYQELANTFMIDEVEFVEGHEMRMVLSPGKGSTRMDREQFRRAYMTLADETSRLVTADLHGTFIESLDTPNPLRMLFSVIRNDLGVHGEDEVEMCLASPSISVSHRMPAFASSPSRHVRSLTFALGSEMRVDASGASGRPRRARGEESMGELEDVDDRMKNGQYDIPTKDLEEKMKESSAIMIPRRRTSSMHGHSHQRF